MTSYTISAARNFSINLPYIPSVKFMYNIRNPSAVKVNDVSVIQNTQKAFIYVFQKSVET